ncbi:MAG: hypothetical protein ACRC34_02880, partial [Cetobacterium sp.]
LDNSIYTLLQDGIYKDGVKKVSENNIQDFGTLQNNIIYLKNNRLIGTEYFSGNSPVIEEGNNLVDYIDLKEYSIFAFSKNLYIYDKNKLSWKQKYFNTGIKSIYTQNEKIYVLENRNLNIYSMSGNEILKKSFKWDIKSFKVEDNIPIVLIENNKQKEINIYKDSWLTIAESEKAEFNFEDIIDVYTENNILYFLTKNGVFKKDKSWTQVLNKIYQNGKFEKYNNKLAVVQENKVEYLDDKSENRVIENSAYYKNNSNEYYLKNGSLYTDSLKNTLALNLSNTYSSFNQNEKYYYLTTEGLAQYNLKNHTWNYQKNIFGVINSYEIIENNIFLNTRNGLFKIDLSTLKIEHYLQNKNIINSNLAYAIEDEIGVKKLYELKNNVYEKVNSENNDFKLTEIEAVDIKNENLRIYTKKDIFNYNENKNTLEKFSSNKIGDITNFGEYKEIRYLFNGEKIQVEDSDYNS